MSISWSWYLVNIQNLVIIIKKKIIFGRLKLKPAEDNLNIARPDLVLGL